MAEEYQVATPEAIDISYAIAGIGSRFVAIFVDSLIEVILFVIVIFGSVGLMQLPDPGPTAGAITMLTLSFVLFWGYFLIFEAIWSGQTPGKRMMRIRVIRTSGHPIGFIESLVRNLVRFIDFLPTMYALGVVVMFINSQSRRLGDLAAGTVVVKERPRVKAGELPMQPIYRRDVPPAGALDPEELQWDLRALTAPDVQLVEDYLERAPGFPPAVRQRVGGEVAGLVATRIGAREPLDPGPFLRRVRDLIE